ncbi:hypothetical protein F5890DRAFT_1510887 [Lentinula detonsa]|uniref:Uncharacterized protein n=1 Tax=Lentinula detonsa TaxID=2804962 RepID=A0AA38USW9_9AGAR|nr:hypothetical protein F5890DRAFT_1510887 [Lentinula detonsa]
MLLATLSVPSGTLFPWVLITFVFNGYVLVCLPSPSAPLRNFKPKVFYIPIYNVDLSAVELTWRGRSSYPEGDRGSLQFLRSEPCRLQECGLTFGVRKIIRRFSLSCVGN